MARDLREQRDGNHENLADVTAQGRARFQPQPLDCPDHRCLHLPFVRGDVEKDPHLGHVGFVHSRSMRLVLAAPRCLRLRLAEKGFRRMYASARLHAADGLLRNSDWVPMTGRAIHQVLTRVDWTNAFRRCGICDDMERFRLSLKELLHREPLVAERLSDEKLRCLINKTTSASRYNVNWSDLILGFADRVATLPADAVPVPGGTHALPVASWSCQDPPAGVCQRMATVNDVLRWPMAPVQHLEPLLALPPALSQPVPLKAVRGSSPVRNARSQGRPLMSGVLRQEYSATASSSRAPGASSQGGSSSSRRRT